MILDASEVFSLRRIALGWRIRLVGDDELAGVSCGDPSFYGSNKRESHHYPLVMSK